ncbi:MAG: Gfo/Idh/MocA family oxidoreductase [Elusimicrobia bacterium]|nr:Gfo/Idh/MocA family oxidoreductase [Elusimicrobiota bacterium]
MEEREPEEEKKVRYAVVGLGPVTQAGVLPAFGNAAENCELTAFVSDDPLKHKKLGKRYRVSLTYSYGDYDACMRSGEVDAVYLALPLRLRKEFALRAIEAGLHVLSERPLGATEEDCEALQRAAARKRVKVAVAYRLYQQEGNLKAIEFCRAGKIGEVRSFVATVASATRPDDFRLERPGGPLYHLGIDAIHMARKLIDAEPVEAFASAQKTADGKRPDESVTSLLRFPGDRQATLFTSLSNVEASYFHAFGAKGDLRSDPAFDLDAECRHVVNLQGKRRERSFDPREPYAPTLLRFSDCVLKGSDPETGIAEALADVRVLRALERSLAEGKPVKVQTERPAAAPELQKLATRRPFAQPLSQATGAAVPLGGASGHLITRSVPPVNGRAQPQAKKP